jgi:hypothetical protein
MAAIRGLRMKALHSSYMMHAEAVVIAEAIAKLSLDALY